MKAITLEELNKKREELIKHQELTESLKPVIEELKQDDKVKRYIDADMEYRKSKNIMDRLMNELKYQEMFYCEHYFVVNEHRSEFDGHRTDRTTIKTCIHCGLTNRYIDFYMDPVFPEYNDMNEVFINSGAYSYKTRGFYDYDAISEVKQLYDKFKSEYPNAADEDVEKHIAIVKRISKGGK